MSYWGRCATSRALPPESQVPQQGATPFLNWPAIVRLGLRFWLYAAGFSLLALSGMASPAEALFAEGTRAYRAADYVRAAWAFRESAQRQPAAGALENLGIAEWQLGQTGPGRPRLGTGAVAGSVRSAGAPQLAGWAEAGAVGSAGLDVVGGGVELVAGELVGVDHGGQPVAGDGDGHAARHSASAQGFVASGGGCIWSDDLPSQFARATGGSDPGADRFWTCSGTHHCG